MLDGIVFEKVGIPAASIVTDVFEATGHAMAQSWGVPEYRFLALPRKREREAVNGCPPSGGVRGPCLGPRI